MSSLVVKINITTPPLTTSGTVYCIVYDSGVANSGTSSPRLIGLDAGLLCPYVTATAAKDMKGHSIVYHPYVSDERENFLIPNNTSSVPENAYGMTIIFTGFPANT